MKMNDATLNPSAASSVVCDIDHSVIAALDIYPLKICQIIAKKS